jgi:hypothetical protein
MKTFIIHHHDALRMENCIEYIDCLDPNRKWRVEITEYRKRRSNEQNAYIHAVPLKMIGDHTGYTIDDIKEYLCGEYFGWEEYTVMGATRQRPLKTTSQLNTKEMNDFIDWMQWWASSTLNMNIPSPNEWTGEDDE